MSVNNFFSVYSNIMWGKFHNTTSDSKDLRSLFSVCACECLCMCACLVRFGWVGFYGISTIIGYLMLNSFLCIKTVLFQTIQFSISTRFKCQNIFISSCSVLLTKLNSYKYCDASMTIQLNISHLFTHC